MRVEWLKMITTSSRLILNQVVYPAPIPLQLIQVTNTPKIKKPNTNSSSSWEAVISPTLIFITLGLPRGFSPVVFVISPVFITPGIPRRFSLAAFVTRLHFLGGFLFCSPPCYFLLHLIDCCYSLCFFCYLFWWEVSYEQTSSLINSPGLCFWWAIAWKFGNDKRL